MCTTRQLQDGPHTSTILARLSVPQTVVMHAAVIIYCAMIRARYISGCIAIVSYSITEWCTLIFSSKNIHEHTHNLYNYLVAS